MFNFNKTLQLKNCLGLQKSDRLYYANLFSDGFESGDLSAWSSSVTDSGDLSAAVGAKINGNYGLNCVIDDTNAIYVQDDTPNAEKRYRCRFYFDPNSLTMANADTFALLRALVGVTTTFVVNLRYITASGYQLQINEKTDSGSFGSLTNFYVITDAPHYIEVDWLASSAPGANDGTYSLYIDGALKETVSGVDNDTEAIDTVRLGAPQNLDAGTSGTFYIDDFASNNDGSAIGAVAGTTQPSNNLMMMGGLNI